MTDVIARDDEIGTVLCEAAHHEMHMRVVVVQWAMGAEIVLHLDCQVACKSPEVGHLAEILRRDVARRPRRRRSPRQRRAEGAPRADHPGLDDDATIGGEQTAAAECGTASTERRAAAPGPPLLPVVEPGSTPACLLARRTSLMKLSRRPRLPMDPIRISNSLSSLRRELRNCTTNQRSFHF
jgi:hypothetical protein